MYFLVTGQITELFAKDQQQACFLVDVFPATDVANFNTVCNPLTHTALKLPAFSSISNLHERGIVSGDEHSQNQTYTVVAVGTSSP